VFLLITLNFFLPRLMPSDRISAMVDASSPSYVQDNSTRAALEAYYGLDRPLGAQYLSYLGGLAHGDLGTSIRYQVPVSQLMVEQLPWTLLLLASAMAISISTGWVAGIHSGWRRNRPVDRGLLTAFMTLRSFPVFFVGSLALFVLSVRLGWFPLTGAQTPFTEAFGLQRIGDVAHHLVLPATVIALGFAGSEYLVMRASMVSELGADYLMLGRSKGLRDRRLKYRHAARNALLPVVALAAVHIGMAVTEILLVETVFVYPGIGRLAFDAISYRDYPILQGCFLVLTMLVVTANFLADALSLPPAPEDGRMSREQALRAPLVLGGGGLDAVLALAAVLAPLLAPYDPRALSGEALLRPSGRHLLGTNGIGQDIFSQLVWGARTSLAVALVGFAGSDCRRGRRCRRRASRWLAGVPGHARARRLPCCAAATAAGSRRGAGRCESDQRRSRHQCPYLAGDRSPGVRRDMHSAATRLPHCRSRLRRRSPLSAAPAPGACARPDPGQQLHRDRSHGRATAGLIGISRPVGPHGDQLGADAEQGVGSARPLLQQSLDLVGAAGRLRDHADSAWLRLSRSRLGTLAQPALATGGGGTTPLLEVSELAVRFGSNVEALRGVSFRLDRGESLAIVGETGSGKSTLAMCLTGLVQPPQACGSVRVAGQELLGADPDALRQLRYRMVALALQGAPCNPVVSVGDQVAEPLREHRGLGKGQARARAEELAAEVLLDPSLLDRFPHQLSGGERRRSTLAMVLALDPPLVVLDEPTAGLDPATRHGVVERLTALVDARGFGLIVISHDLPDATRLAGRCLVLYAGQVMELGPSTSVISAPTHYTWSLVGAFPVLTATKDLRPIRGRPPDPRAVPPGCPYNPRCTQAEEVCTTPPPLVVFRGREVLCHFGGLKTLLSAVGIEKTFRGQGRETRALRGVSLDLRQGESLGIIGSSGSGKSTLARILVGQLAPDAGQVSLEGQPLSPLGADRPASCVGESNSSSRTHGMHCHPDSPWWSWSVSRSMWPMPTTVRRVSWRCRRRWTAWGSTSGDFLTARSHELSGGQLQRISLARALVVRPKLLIADEPTSMLDASEQARLLVTLRERQVEMGLGLVLVSHDVAAVRKVTDRIVILDAGRIAEEGPSDRLDQPKQPGRSPTARVRTGLPGRRGPNRGPS
jgi:peptide/nickel transport system ATP-binding protein